MKRIEQFIKENRLGYDGSNVAYRYKWHPFHHKRITRPDLNLILSLMYATNSVLTDCDIALLNSVVNAQKEKRDRVATDIRRRAEVARDIADLMEKLADWYEEGEREVKGRVGSGE